MAHASRLTVHGIDVGGLRLEAAGTISTSQLPCLLASQPSSLPASGVGLLSSACRAIVSRRSQAASVTKSEAFEATGGLLISAFCPLSSET
jgi:hypothetical protein